MLPINAWCKIPIPKDTATITSTTNLTHGTTVRADKVRLTLPRFMRGSSDNPGWASRMSISVDPRPCGER